MDLYDSLFGAKTQTTGTLQQVGLDEEQLGWERWLKLLGPETFFKPFGKMHETWWEAVWPIMMKRQQGIPLKEDEMVFMAILARGLGKSSQTEWTAIMEGSILGKGYTLYVSDTQELAQGHLEAIRARLEASHVATYYPGMANPKVGKYGQKFGWRQDTLITESGWGIAAFGLDTGMRGGKLIDQRPSLIILDDIDSLHDTPQTINRKIDVLARSIFPTGSSDTVILLAQNLIHRNSVVNKIITGQVNLLAQRKQTAIVPAVYNLRTQRMGTRDVIVEGTPAWEGFDLVAAQKAIDDSTLEAFLAEYQHDFKATLEGLVIPEFNESVHIISWSQFAGVYGYRSIPSHWQRDVGMDWGSTGLHAHPAVVSFIATSAEDSALPGMYFLYHGMTFDTGVIVDEVAHEIMQLTGRDPDKPTYANLEGWGKWIASHEAKSERDTFRVKFGIPFRSAKAGRRTGVEMWRHFMKTDYTLPHAFKPGQRGVSQFFWIVEDDQLTNPYNDRGLFRWREEVADWRWRPQVLGMAGLVQEVPVKFMDDACDSIRYLTEHFMPPKTPFTVAQKYENKLPEPLRRDNKPAGGPELEQWDFARWVTKARIQKRDAMMRGHAETRNRNR
jgi:hypothetical protein